ncbi:uncharacterized protein LOC124496395 [Dermatophagoides farinae]|uniref:uncharacterized protein LOC124496395 n=1 Tax=Dermatophagoides farinae TaxID=6954 RepID=UPI003F5E7588
MAITFHKIEYNIIRTMTTLLIITLIILSVYHLNLTLEFLKKLIDHIEETDSVYERHASKNRTLAKMMFEPMQRTAHSMYEKHEPAILMNVVILTSVIAFSMAGLVAALRKHKIMLFIYAIALDLIYLTTFLYCARLPSIHCSLIVFVSIIVYLRVHHLWSKNSTDKVHLLQASTTTSTTTTSATMAADINHHDLMIKNNIV